jgi:hypothetical protein
LCLTLHRCHRIGIVNAFAAQVREALGPVDIVRANGNARVDQRSDASGPPGDAARSDENR